MKLRTALLGISALFVTLNAAFFSVSGLGKLFAGAGLSVISMASSLEFAKIIAAGYVYNYWDRMNKLFRIYMSIAIFVLVLITSLGIYGILTSAFQETYNKYSVTTTQRDFLEKRVKFWENDLARYDSDLEKISNRIDNVTNGTITGGKISNQRMRLSQSRLNSDEKLRDNILLKRQMATDSIQSIQVKLLNIDTNIELGSELGSLEYLSKLLQKPMDEIVNWFILIIIFVFDPLAIALVIAFNNALKLDKDDDVIKKETRELKLYDDSLNNTIENSNKITPPTNNVTDSNLSIDTHQNNGVPTANNMDSTPNVLDEIYLPSELSNTEYNLVDSDNVNSRMDENSPSILDELPPYTDLDLVKPDPIVIPPLVDSDGDGIVTNEEYENWYESGGWRMPYNGNPYYTNPKFDWSKKDRWINDRRAIDYWIKFQGGTQKAANEFEKESNYPTDFTKKTY